VDPILLDDANFQHLHQQFRTKIDLGAFGDSYVP
jgi:hypothetical protein